MSLLYVQYIESIFSIFCIFSLYCGISYIYIYTRIYTYIYIYFFFLGGYTGKPACEASLSAMARAVEALKIAVSWKSAEFSSICRSVFVFSLFFTGFH